MTERELGLIGLGVRAGTVAIGVGAVRSGLQRGAIKLVVLAQDRSQRTEEKVGRLAAQRGVRVLEGPPAVALGTRFGYADVQALGVHDQALADGIEAGTTGPCRRM